MVQCSCCSKDNSKIIWHFIRPTFPDPPNIIVKITRENEAFWVYPLDYTDKEVADAIDTDKVLYGKVANKLKYNPYPIGIVIKFLGNEICDIRECI